MQAILRLFLVSFSLLLLVIFILWFLLRKFKNYRKLTINEIPLSIEESNEHDQNIEIRDSCYVNTKIAKWPLPRINDNYDYICTLYKELNDQAQKKFTVPTVGEWLLDNFYIIEEQAKLLRRDLNKKSFSFLPILKSGNLEGNARIYAIILELVFDSNGEVDEELLLKHLQEYQQHTVLFDREIWAIPIAIKIALLEYIRCQCEKLKISLNYLTIADEMIDAWLDSKGEGEKKLLKQLNNTLQANDKINTTFIERLLFRFRRSGLNYTHFLHTIDNNLSKFGKNSESMAQEEHHTQSINTLIMGNCITSLRYFTKMDWEELFESVSCVEQILRFDPEGTYQKMNLASRNFYRGKVEELSAAFNVSPIRIAKEAVSLARKAWQSSKRKGIKNNKHMRLWHVGYYLIEIGLHDLKMRLGTNSKVTPKRSPEFQKISNSLYLGAIVLVTSIIVGLAVQYALLNSTIHEVLYAFIAGIATLIPASEIAISLVNFIVCKTIQPAIFPKLELKDGIPENLSTIVAIPTLLPNEKRVMEILETLESHYLSNREQNLYFALIGAFSDADKATEDNYETIINTTLSGIKELNQKYAPNQKNIFYFYHRSSIFNKKNNKWFGWERKRGALIEFNDLILGSKDTSFTTISSNDLPFSRIKYIIPLDCDTILPMGMAKKMIGTMAHPLNTPIIDKKRGIVTEGYGIMQPRVEVDIESSNKSLFSLIFTGQEGIDPYANAISNVYQDLFEEGIFTGKGIYDLQFFQQVLKNAFPDDAILSHDLLEGSYLRTGLLTDLELVDSYPTKYNSYTSRDHRWTRGDWQLIPFLFGKIVNRKNKKISNPLSLLSRWKIFDNLRRSLVSLSLIILFALSIIVLPGNTYVWFGLFLITISFPFIIAIFEYFYAKRSGTSTLKRHIPVMVGLKASFLQFMLTFIFMINHAILHLHAILITLGRLIITKKNMLEWVTSSEQDKSNNNSLADYFKKMKYSYVVLVIFILLTISFKPSALILVSIICLCWGIAPYIAYWISQEKKELNYKISEEDELMLRRVSRKTWRYFEEFVDQKNHYLAPDNYQADPLKGIAHRTSPTNIGLGLLATLSARDFGYITTSDMIELLQKTVSTINSLKKWNGHLYNWYDTKTLRPLRPEYISTVDSGNLICYLITLEQGLEEYLHRPLVEHNLLQGIKDTVLCGEKESYLFYKNFLTHALPEKHEPINMIWWGDLLEKLFYEIEYHVSSESIWKDKYLKLITSCQKEIFTFFPWIDLLKRVPAALKNEKTNSHIIEMTEKLVSISKKSTALNGLPSIYHDSITCADKLISLITQTNQEDYDESLIWLNDWKEVLNNATIASKKLIGILLSIKKQIAIFHKSMVFLPLYEKKKQLFSIGFNIEDDKLSNSYYDLLASEARQASFISIARGEISPNHWFKLGRSLTVVDSYKGLVSWSGSMFEYLMPLLLMKSYKNTLLDETYSFAIKSQKKYGKQRKMPWGTSESGYNLLDKNLDYQYKAIGVPWLGLKRGLVDDAVCAPYATFMALLVDPQSSIQNINYLINEGLEGLYGFYEAADYTKERLRFESKRAIVRSYMAHHQGMSYLALNNFLNINIMQHRFHNDPAVNSARFLLQEKIPSNLVITKESKVKITSYKESISSNKYLVRKFTHIDPVLPKVHILSNGSYSLMLTDKGSGYSKNKSISVTRWREDKTLDQFGMFFYLRNVESNYLWSATYAPLNINPENYEVNFSADKATYKRLDHNIKTTTEVVVTPSDNVEIRRLTLRNTSEKTCFIEITSYFEVSLSSQMADIAHPAFQNLFVETQIHPEKNCIIAKRRPRSEHDKTFWISNSVYLEGTTIGDIQFETDRMQLIGRGHSVSNPYVIENGKPLSNSSGSVLDPIMSIRILVKIEAGKTSRLSFVTAVSHGNESLRQLIDKYSNSYAVDRAFRHALTRSQIENQYFNLTETELALYQNMLSHIIFISPAKIKYQDLILKNKKGQSSLWRFGISGDHAIVLLVLQKTDQIDLLYEVLKAHDYWSSMDMRIDLIILSDEEYCYNQPLCGLVNDIVLSKQTHNILSKPGDIFILNYNTLEKDDLNLLYAVARIVLKGNEGTMEEQIETNIPSYPHPIAQPLAIPSKTMTKNATKNTDLQFYNNLGGFSLNGQEYIIQLEKNHHTPAPWINVVSNPDFGFITSEAGSGFTWNENSHEYKLTPWSNDPVTDPPGEILYITDTDTKESFTVTSLPIRDEEIYTIRHGFGYSVFEHTSHELEQSLVQFVPVNETIKVSILTLKNTSEHTRHLNLTYYIRPILGVSDQDTAMFIQTRLDESGIMIIQNPYNVHFSGKMVFLDSSINERSVTSDRKAFFGFGDYRLPDSLSEAQLSGAVGTNFDPCAVIQVNVTLQANESKEVVFLLGSTSEESNIQNLSTNYRKIEEAKKALANVQSFWDKKLGILQINTPADSINTLLNGWLPYQVIACRLWARSGFYQSGGAFGFRDQLQDCLSIAHISPEITRAQILHHATRQFEEGDVQHWWHEPQGIGIRTRCSDDLLWLPYATAEYIRITGDESILDEMMPFLQDKVLSETEVDRFSSPQSTQESYTLYEHCVRAIDYAFKFGEHDLPLIGSGDWNDGMSTVGHKGSGESVWLGWFLLTILSSFTPICIARNDESRASLYPKVSECLLEAIESNAWDGNWYLRAFFDDGTPLGSIQNKECKIDSIAQTWALISGKGNPNRVKMAMNSLEDYLISREEGLIKLISPPFYDSKLEPGYIKGYLPGVRENGGQYTHAAAWVIIAFAMLGDGDKAWELFELINPLNHTENLRDCAHYKLEPYVMAADVYSGYPNKGRGGWSWYTGSAGWIYRAVLEYILGFQKNGNTLIMNPCIPKEWKEYSISYQYLSSTYHIKVYNPNNLNKGVLTISIDGKIETGNNIALVNDGKHHQINVNMG